MPTQQTNKQTEEKEPGLYEKQELFLMKRKESTYSVFFGLHFLLIIGTL